MPRAAPKRRNPEAAVAFGLRLRQLRGVRGWSQQALADSADISKRTIYLVEKARLSPTLDVLASLAFALEIPVTELLRWQ